MGLDQQADNAPLSHESATAYPWIPNKHRIRLERGSRRLTRSCLRLPAH